MKLAGELSEGEVQTCLNCESIEGSLEFLVMVSRASRQRLQWEAENDKVVARERERE
jgi:hypothetical protein